MHKTMLATIAIGAGVFVYPLFAQVSIGGTAGTSTLAPATKSVLGQSASPIVSHAPGRARTAPGSGNTHASMVGSGATVDAGATVDPGATVDTGATVDPGATVDAGATVDPGATKDSGAGIDIWAPANHPSAGNSQGASTATSTTSSAKGH